MANDGCVRQGGRLVSPHHSPLPCGVTACRIGATAGQGQGVSLTEVLPRASGSCQVVRLVLLRCWVVLAPCITGRGLHCIPTKSSFCVVEEEVWHVWLHLKALTCMN